MSTAGSRAGGFKSFALVSKYVAKKKESAKLDLTDQQYHDLCLEVTRRIVTNNFDERIQYDKFFKNLNDIKQNDSNVLITEQSELKNTKKKPSRNAAISSKSVTENIKI